MSITIRDRSVDCDEHYVVKIIPYRGSDSPDIGVLNSPKPGLTREP